MVGITIIKKIIRHKGNLKMKSLVFGIIGMGWGTAIWIAPLLQKNETTSGAYETGQNCGMVFGGILFVAGLLAVIRYFRTR